jgi:hypothetical protein
VARKTPSVTEPHRIRSAVPVSRRVIVVAPHSISWSHSCGWFYLLFECKHACLFLAWRDLVRVHQVAALKARAQEPSHAEELYLDRADGAARQPSHFLDGFPLQVTMNHQAAVPAWQPIEFRMEGNPEFCALSVALALLGRDRLLRQRHQAAAPRGLGIKPGCHPTRDGLEPRSEHLAVANVPCLSREGQKGHLECVLSVLSLGSDLPARPQYHGPMSFHEQREGRLGLVSRPGQENLKQSVVG